MWDKDCRRKMGGTEDKQTEDFIKRKMMEAADDYERKLQEDASLDDIQLTDDMVSDMMRLIAEEDARNEAGRTEPAPDAMSVMDHVRYIPKEDEEALKIGRKVLRWRKYGKILKRIGIAAAALVIVVGVSMTSSANRLWLLNMWYSLTGKEAVIQMDNVDGVTEHDDKEKEACAEILDKTGIHAVRFFYFPKEMEFCNYMVNEELATANMFFEYQDTMFTVSMVKEGQETASEIILDGEVLSQEEVETRYGTVSVMEIQAPEGGRDYTAEFLYDNCQYTFFGVLPREEFLKMIKNINFY